MARSKEEEASTTFKPISIGYTQKSKLVYAESAHGDCLPKDGFCDEFLPHWVVQRTP